MVLQVGNPKSTADTLQNLLKPKNNNFRHMTNADANLRLWYSSTAVDKISTDNERQNGLSATVELLVRPTYMPSKIINRSTSRHSALGHGSYWVEFGT